MNFNINQAKTLFNDSDYLKAHDDNINYPSIFNININNTDISECYILEATTNIPFHLIHNSVSLDSSSIKINYPNMCKFTLKVLNILSTKLHFSGNSFSKVPLLLGDLTMYYTQYLANIIFGHPHATEPFINSISLSNEINKAFEKLISIFFDNVSLENFIRESRKIGKKEKIKNLFKKGDILQFDIIINSPTFKNQELLDSNINDTLWKINILIS